jgi:outer membrane protein assembly factor BamB
LAVCGLPAAACGTSAASDSQPQVAAARTVLVPDGDWMTFGYDAQRSGVGPASTGITARNLRSLKVRTVRIGGTVDSAPVALHAIKVGGRTRDVVIVTATYGQTIAIDPGTGQKLWQFTPSDIGSYANSYRVTTATPVIDPNRRYVYTASPDGLIHKLPVASGREVRSGHWPARITFLPAREKIAAALNLSGPSVIATTGGYIGDAPPYQGHVVMIDRASGRITHVFNTLCSNRPGLIVAPGSCPANDSAILSRAGAVVEPGSRRILVATGNGPFNGSTDWGDSVLELSPDASRLVGHWTPADQARLNDTDTDLGSASPAVIPAAHLAVQGGKDELLHVLDRLHEVQTLGTPGGAEQFAQPAVWSHGGRAYVFVTDTSGTAAYVVSAGRLRRVWSNGTAGTSPVVAGGLLYAFDLNGGSLNVYDPARGNLLASLPADGGHWNSPIVVGGRIILPVGNYMDHSLTGRLFIYHLPGR